MAAVCDGLGGDRTPPELEITSPTRSSFVTSGDVVDLSLLIKGTASDGQSRVVSVTVNGVEDPELQPGLAVNFFVPFTSRWGVGTLVAEATDECGNTRRVVQSFVRSGGYYPASTEVDAAAAVETASLTRLSWKVFDDDDRSTMNDATSILSVNVPQFDWDEVIPRKIVTATKGPSDCEKLTDTWLRSTDSVTVVKFDHPAPPPESEAEKKKAARGTPLKVLTVEPRANDRLRTEFFVNNIAIDLTVTSYKCTAGLLDTAVRHGTVEFDDTLAAARFTLQATEGDLEMIVEPGAITVATKTSVNVQCDVQFLCDALSDLALPRLRGLINDQMSAKASEKQWRNKLERVIRKLLPALGSTTLALPPPFDVEIGVDAQLSRVITYPLNDGQNRGVALRVDIQHHASARGDSIPEDAPGSVARASASMPVNPYRSVQIRERDDLINQLFWALWYGGGFAFEDLTQEAADDGGASGLALSAFSATAGLPPILMSGGDDRVEFGRGDNLFTMAGTLSGIPFTATGFWSSLTGGTLWHNAEVNRLQLLTDSRAAEVELTSVSGGIDAALLRPLLAARFAAIDAVLLEKVISTLEIPSPDLEPMTGIAGSRLRLTRAIVDNQLDAATRIRGDLEEIAICGDGLVVLDEQCDDGNASDFDICSSTCRAQEQWGFVGVANGGETIAFAVNRFATSFETEPGDDAETIAAKAAAAINANVGLTTEFPNLVASARGSFVYVDGTFSERAIADAGLATCGGHVPGDANDDRRIDGADYTIWADGFGSVQSFSADFNCDAVVDGADYTLWADDYDAPAIPAADSAATVTESGLPTAVPASGRAALFSMGVLVVAAGAWFAGVGATSTRTRTR